ncbi:MAG TPA: DUF475 domain-containing protein [Streptosporangiaceae bacterium]|nr:DUF475 domain-containing protein [Streptosporangiaceae bacterium]
MLALFRLPVAVTIIGIVAAGVLGGVQVAGVVAILAVLEISLSFDNAVVNATVLQKMNPYWQRIFLTVGVLIAVFGMRLLFPLIVVTIAGHISPGHAIDLALHHPHEYAAKLTQAHPAIGAFGGIFLLMIFLDFLFEDQEIKWLEPIERQLAKIGKLDQASAIIALVFLIISATTFAHKDAIQVLLSGASGLATYLAVSSLSALFESEEEAVVGGDGATAEESEGGESPVRVPTNLARLGLFTFLYLEVLDASFSFDGVVGAFAITDMIFVIALGLGIGACYIRALTVYLVRKGTLAEYVYLEHGAHWAIGSLAILLFVTIRVKVPDLVTGLIGVGFIGAALISSIMRNRRAEQVTETSHVPEPLGT